jgi:hypothetical protein
MGVDPAEFSRDPNRPRLSDSLNFSSRFIERINYDIEGVLNGPKPPWYQRWQRSKNRAAARRTLRSMLRIYCPDLLDGFEEAVANRTALVSEYRREFYEVLEDPHTNVADLGNMYHGMETTRRELLAARGDLRELIRKSFPVLSTG